MNVLDAAHKTVLSYPGGSEALCTRIDMSAAVLRSKVNPAVKTHRLAIEEADEIMGVTQDYSILQALAANHGFGLIKLEEVAQPATIEQFLLASNVAAGDLARVIRDALADGVISKNDLQLIEQTGAAAQAVIISLVGRLRAHTRCAGKE